MSKAVDHNSEMLDGKLEVLWKDYAQLFNEYNPLLEEFQREKMESILQEIRLLESEREKIVMTSEI